MDDWIKAVNHIYSIFNNFLTIMNTMFTVESICGAHRGLKFKLLVIMQSKMINHTHKCTRFHHEILRLSVVVH